MPTNLYYEQSTAALLKQVKLLLQYGLMSGEFLIHVAPIGTRATIFTEVKNELDYWRRQLGYAILPSDECLNEILLMNGYAKASQ